jgi:acyl-CoA dehydrogenase
LDEVVDLVQGAADPAAVAKLGLLGLTIPQRYGGLGLNLQSLEPYLEVAGSGPGWLRMLVHVANGFWRPVDRFGSAEQRQIIPALASGDAVLAFALTERAGGTGRDTHSRAVRDADGWCLFGEKHLITFADRADAFLITVATDERKAVDSLTTFLVPRNTPGLVIDATQETMGLTETGHGILLFDGVALPDSARLGGIGQGLEVALSFLDYSRISLSACMVGLAQHALDCSVDFARQRATFGRPIAQRQAIQMHLADMHADVSAARALVRHAARCHDAGVPLTMLASTTKLFCQGMVGRVTDLALRVHGGYGYTKDAPIERLYRDARGFWFEEGTAEIQQLVIARNLLA